jgi:hypothetical protein
MAGRVERAGELLTGCDGAGAKVELEQSNTLASQHGDDP